MEGFDMSEEGVRSAVVLGGGMAGLLAARVLADTHRRVVVVDRDVIGDSTTARKGVPQGRHVHGLLARGQQILEEHFPGFTEEAVAAGIPTADLGELRWFFNGRRLSPAPTGLTCVSATRPLLESRVRARVAALENVSFLEGHDIVGLTVGEDGHTVTGVRVHGAAGGERSVGAELVVDTTGRGSRTPAWLEEMGYQRPREERIGVDLTYTTRLFRLPDESVLRGDMSINPVSSPSHRRGAFLSRIEDGLIVVSLTGVLGESAPTELEGFLAWTRTLAVPDIHDVIKDAEPVCDGTTFRFPTSVRRRYDELTRFPKGLVVMGDAVCSFNPVYGQGMTVSALESLVLREHVAGGPVDPRAYFRDLTGVIEVPWQMSAGSDLGYPEVEGERTAEWERSGRYMADLHTAATVDGTLTATFMRVAGLVDPPTALMDPEVMRRVEEGVRRVGAAVA
ncbi:NAD(P)/FAD-dependent oxidoreductase [Streptomyces sp. ST2-7A]|uniref:FAD-dependent oxidoreductase n=1 Tax=Streptomyces sp. ST2-7A TaxID=2907214 RepID=UPI001F2271F3|nr:FAD-dependent oxidoreductase [Streptomyces sp. ST2-7A]MCE7079480.1 FAD-dependent oxidoreductase [Streptomyces sp. ST2-7A]